jgi:hypothetical protein
MPNKICPKCNASKHVRVSKCDCGHAFYATKSEKPNILVEVKTENPSAASVSGGFLSFVKKAEESPKPAINTNVDHDSPGRGKKQCDNCKKYVGGVLKICNLCGFNFENKNSSEEKAITYEVKTFDGPGKGKKPCPKCKKYVGVRANKCECGYDFAANPKTEIKKPVLLPAKSSTIIIPPKPSFLSVVKTIATKTENKTEEKEKKLTKFLKTGQGRKTCPDCKSIIPVATRTCDCGFFFEKKEKSEAWTREEKPVYAGEYLTYNVENPYDDYVRISIENENEREYLIEFKNFTNISSEEIDAELIFLDSKEKLNSKKPEEVVEYLKERFKIQNIRWLWNLSDSQFENELKLPVWLRYSKSNKQRYYGSPYTKQDFLISRNEYCKKYQIGDVIPTTCPNYRREGNKLVIIKNLTSYETKQNWIMPKYRNATGGSWNV